MRTTSSRRARSSGAEPRPSYGPGRTSSTVIWACERLAGVGWIDPEFPKTATGSELVGPVLGVHPGLMTGPGTNTYPLGRRDPILIDTGAGRTHHPPPLQRHLAARGVPHPPPGILH